MVKVEVEVTAEYVAQFEKNQLSRSKSSRKSY